MQVPVVLFIALALCLFANATGIKKNNAENAKLHPENTKPHPENAKPHPENAKPHPEIAKLHAENAKPHPENAMPHAENAKLQAENAKNATLPAQEIANRRTTYSCEKGPHPEKAGWSKCPPSLDGESMGERQRQSTLTNAAKCRCVAGQTCTQTEDQTDGSRIEGTLDCDTDLRPSTAYNQGLVSGNDCPDNLSTGRYFHTLNYGDGYCQTFAHNRAANGAVTAVTSNGVPRVGVITKPYVGHPNGASRNVGMLGLKRMICYSDEAKTMPANDGAHCTVYKNAVCIKCSSQMFGSSWDFAATAEEKNNFVTNCAMQAFDNAGTASASIKTSYECTHPADLKAFISAMKAQ